MSARTTVLAFLFVATLGIAPAAADTVVFSNLGPDDSFNRDVALWFGYDTGEEGDPDYRFARAVPFVAEATARLQTIEMALGFYHWLEPGTLQVNLYHANGAMPGELVESFSRSEPYDGDSLLLFQSTLAPLLMAGNTYFLEATTTARTDGLWFVSLFDQSHRDVYRVDNGPWVLSGGTLEIGGAVRVSGDAPVPEPATLVLLVTGLGVAGWRRARSRPLRKYTAFK